MATSHQAASSSDAGDREFTPFEKMAEDTNCWETRKLNSIKKWIALEKIHGANFSFTVSRRGGAGAGSRDSLEVGVAKRGGYLQPGDRFFGVWRQKGFLEKGRDSAKMLFAAVMEEHPEAAAVTIYGELFGGYYPHPAVEPVGGVVPVQTEVVYCPDLKFIAYDLSLTTPTGKCYMDYDVCMELFKAAGFLYAEPLCTGTLKDMLSFSLGFPSKVPAKLSLPPLEGRKNTAEGIVVKPLKNITLETRKGPRRVIFKRKVENFMERKQRDAAWKTDPKKGSAYDPDYEVLKYEMYALVTEQRVVNVISKQGRPETEEEWGEVGEGLMADVLEELSGEHEEAWSRVRGEAGQFERLLQELRDECKRTVDQFQEKQ